MKIECSLFGTISDMVVSWFEGFVNIQRQHLRYVLTYIPKLSSETLHIKWWYIHVLVAINFWMRCLVSGVGLWWWSTPWFTCLQYWSGFSWILWHSLSPSQHQCMYNTIEVHTMYMYNLQHVWITRIYIATTSKRALIMLSCWIKSTFVQMPRCT